MCYCCRKLEKVDFVREAVKSSNLIGLERQIGLSRSKSASLAHGLSHLLMWSVWANQHTADFAREAVCERGGSVRERPICEINIQITWLSGRGIQKSITNNQSASLAQIGLSSTDRPLLHSASLAQIDLYRTDRPLSHRLIRCAISP